MSFLRYDATGVVFGNVLLTNLTSCNSYQPTPQSVQHLSLLKFRSLSGLQVFLLVLGTQRRYQVCIHSSINRLRCFLSLQSAISGWCCLCMGRRYITYFSIFYRAISFALTRGCVNILLIGRHGQLGLGNKANVNIPTEIPPSTWNNSKIVSAALGSRHSLFLDGAQ